MKRAPMLPPTAVCFGACRPALKVRVTRQTLWNPEFWKRKMKAGDEDVPFAPFVRWSAGGKAQWQRLRRKLLKVCDSNRRHGIMTMML